MKKYFLAVFILILSTAVAASDIIFKNIEDQCVRAHLRSDALLQFLYKFDGNLPSIKDTKIKNIKFLISQFSDFNSSNASRRQAFDELFNDPDYYQFLVQEKSLNLIKELEEFKLNSSPSKDKNLIFSLPNTSRFDNYQNPFYKIKKLVRMQDDVRNFFDELESSKIRLEQLNQQHRLAKSLAQDPQNLAMIIAINKTALSAVISCNLSYLEAERTSK